MFDTEVAGISRGVGDALDALEAAIDKVFASEQRLDVARMHRLAERVEFLRLRCVRAFDLSAEWQADGFASTASALRERCRMAAGDAHATIALARKLDELPETAAAFGAGEISKSHAQAIAAGHTPERAEAIGGIEAELVAYARLADAHGLRAVVRRLTDALDGDGGAASDGEQHELNRVSLSRGLEGRGYLDGSLDAEATGIALTALDAMMHVLEQPGDRRDRPQRRAEAFVEICRQSLARDHEGDASSGRRAQPHVSAVVDVAMFEDRDPELVADVRAETEHGGAISRATLERLTCDCKISRVITDGPGRVLDVGRATRTVGDALWRALVVRDRHCRAPGCDRPPGWCEAHHVVHWSRGGRTDLDNLQLLCWQHHRATHAAGTPARGSPSG